MHCIELYLFNNNIHHTPTWLLKDNRLHDYNITQYWLHLASSRTVECIDRRTCAKNLAVDFDTLNTLSPLVFRSKIWALCRFHHHLLDTAVKLAWQVLLEDRFCWPGTVPPGTCSMYLHAAGNHWVLSACLGCVTLHQFWTFQASGLQNLCWHRLWCQILNALRSGHENHKNSGWEVWSTLKPINNINNLLGGTYHMCIHDFRPLKMIVDDGSFW